MRGGRTLGPPSRSGICRMSWVTLPEPMAVEETADAATALSLAGIPLQDVIVNRVTSPPPRRCGWCDGRRSLERRGDRDTEGAAAWSGANRGDSRTKEPRGVSVLARIGEEIRPPDADPIIPVALKPPGDGAPVGGHASSRTALPVAVFAGALWRKGGVGKTTCAAAVALAIAADAPSRPVHLLSTDPAHSLGDVLGQTIGNDLVRLAAVQRISWCVRSMRRVSSTRLRAR